MGAPAGILLAGDGAQGHGRGRSLPCGRAFFLQATELKGTAEAATQEAATSQEQAQKLQLAQQAAEEKQQAAQAGQEHDRRGEHSQTRDDVVVARRVRHGRSFQRKTRGEW